MLCCGVCGKMSKRDYKVATTDGMELEPLGGPATDKDNLTNGLKCGKWYIIYITCVFCYLLNKVTLLYIHLYKLFIQTHLIFSNLVTG